MAKTPLTAMATSAIGSRYTLNEVFAIFRSYGLDLREDICTGMFVASYKGMNRRIDHRDVCGLVEAGDMKALTYMATQIRSQLDKEYQRYHMTMVVPPWIEDYGHKPQDPIPAPDSGKSGSIGIRKPSFKPQTHNPLLLLCEVG